MSKQILLPSRSLGSVSSSRSQILAPLLQLQWYRNRWWVVGLSRAPCMLVVQEEDFLWITDRLIGQPGKRRTKWGPRVCFGTLDCMIRGGDANIWGWTSTFS